MMFRILCLLAVICCSSALVVSPALTSGKAVVSRCSSVEMAAKKKPPAKKGGSSPKGKGGILPWITNEPGTYAEVAMLSSFDFLGADAAKFIGKSQLDKGFSLSQFLYP